MMTELSANHPQGHTKAEEKLLFVECFVALVATSFAFIIRVMLMSDWQIAFGLSETQKGEIFGAGMWPFGLSIVLFSLVIDRVGYGKSMVFAFACHFLSAIMMFMANGYWMLYVASILNGLAAGTVEAVINPAIASMYPKKKTTMLTILHAGWPGGFVLGGIMLLVMGDAVSWNVKAGVILIPTIAYGLLLLKSRFPVSERVAAGVSYRDMLKEAGAIGCLIVVYMVLMEINRVAGLGNITLGGFDLPSVPMTIVMALIVLAYLVYTRSFGRPMYIFLLLVMILLATTELGTDTWIKELMEPAMKKIGLHAGLVLVYTATIMMVLRFCIAPIERLLRPLGVLFASCIFAAVGLWALSWAEGVMILLFATIYGTGQCFFWPVTLGLVSERFPKGGALTLNAMGGVGMLGVGILGSQLLGYWQDTRINDQLVEKGEQVHARLMDEPKKSIFGKYRSIDVAVENEVNDKTALYEYRLQAAKKNDITPTTQVAVSTPTDPRLWEQLKDDKKYQVLVQNAFNHLVRQPDDSKEYTFEEMHQQLEAAGVFVGTDRYEALKADRELINEVRTDAKKNTMATVAILPCIMAVCYLVLILYFKVAHGGYKAIDLTEEGEVAGEHKPYADEAAADAQKTPNE